jgi:hypothetical protein
MAYSSKSREYKELLDKLVVRDEAKLINKDFGKLTTLTLVKFVCKCGQEDEKQIRQFMHHGRVFCKKCAIKATTEKIRAKCIEKYGAPTPFQSKEFRKTILRQSKKGVKYTKELLHEVITKDKAKLKSNCDEYTRNTIIEFVCKCGEGHKKVFRSLVRDGGAKCKKCTFKGMHDKQLATMKNNGDVHPLQRPEVKEKARQNNKGLKYTIELLESVMKKDEATLKGEYDVYTRDVVIKFTCKCGKDHEKMFRYLVEKGGARCKQCSIENGKVKAKTTFVKNYGVSNPMQNKDCVYKIKITTNTFTVDRLTKSLGSNLVGKYDPTTLGRDSLITFKCFCCDEQAEKPFRLIEESIGPFCKKCTWVAKDYLIKKSLKEIMM